MTLIVQLPENYFPERFYIIKLLLNKYIGLEVEIEANNIENVHLELKNDVHKKKLVVKDCFFKRAAGNWLTEESLPTTPLKVWDISNLPIDNANTVSKKVPVIYGSAFLDQSFLQINKKNIFLGLDIFGSAFFMLTRYEELVNPERDEHDRFPAFASLAYQEGFLERPIINEYVEILWCCLKHLWPGLKRKMRQPGIILNHDVDTPYYYAFMPLTKTLRLCAGDIIRRKSLPLSAKRFYDWCAVNKGLIHRDTYNKFDMIMDASDKYNVQSTFFFQPNGNNPFDGNYELEHPLIKKLIQNIHDRGHQIGLHPSYDSYLSPDKIKGEFDLLKSVCEDLGIKQERWGGRQHYLRWQVPYTWQYYEDAGLDYDSSLTYAEYAGFRCGVCYEFPTFNLLTRQELKLIERPLIVMECSLYDEKYMGLSIEQAFQYSSRLIEACKIFNGNFTILWHNNRLVNKEEVNLFDGILDYYFLSAKRD